MGYTHYWKLPQAANLDPKKFEAFYKDLKNLVANLPAHSESAGGYYSDEDLAIRCGMGEKAAVIEKDKVSFNGDASKNLDHETFLVMASVDEHDDEQMSWCRGFQFCKTARKPYDLLVCAALLSLEHHFGRRTTQVKSDGSYEDWKPALKFYRETLKRRPKRALINYLKG